jgi:hypothetical protein
VSLVSFSFFNSIFHIHIFVVTLFAWEKIYLKKCSPWDQSLPLWVALTFLSSHLNFFPCSWFTCEASQVFTPPPSSHVQRFLRLQQIIKIQTWGETWKHTNFGAPLSFTLPFFSLYYVHLVIFITPHILLEHGVLILLF